MGKCECGHTGVSGLARFGWYGKLRSRVNGYHVIGPDGAEAPFFSMLSKSERPVRLPQYAPHEHLIIEVPDLPEVAGQNVSAALADNGKDTLVFIGKVPIIVLTDFTDLSAVNVDCVVKSFDEDSCLYREPAAEPLPVQVINATDKLTTVREFDVRTDRLEVARGCKLRLERARNGSGTLVLVDDDPVFLLPHIKPAQLGQALIAAPSALA